MALYHKWDVKNDFVYVLQFFSLISDSLGSVLCYIQLKSGEQHLGYKVVDYSNNLNGVCNDPLVQKDLQN